MVHGGDLGIFLYICCADGGSVCPRGSLAPPSLSSYQVPAQHFCLTSGHPSCKIFSPIGSFPFPSSIASGGTASRGQMALRS